MSAHQKQDESVVEYMGRVQDNVAKAFPKLADANRQNLAVSMFCQGLHDQDIARMTAVQSKGDVASALHIAASATPYTKEQRYPQRYDPNRRRYSTNVAVDDQESDADEEGDDGDADMDYDEGEEEVFYAGSPGNFRGRGWRGRRNRYGSRFGRRGFGRQPFAYQRAAQQGAPSHSNEEDSSPTVQGGATSTSNAMP